MNATICPTITAADATEYQQQIEKVANFATRIHIDLADGVLAPTTLIALDGVWWPGGVRADIHLMYKKPLDHLQALIALQPQLVIVHAESSGSFFDFANTMHHHGIEAGVALLQTTAVETIRPALEFVDHVLVFSGDLGRFGGKANPALLSKVRALKALKPQLEVSWDGGIDAHNAPALVRAGVEVLNVGGFIQHASDPAAAYDELSRVIGQADQSTPSAPPLKTSTASTASATQPATTRGIKAPLSRGSSRLHIGRR